MTLNPVYSPTHALQCPGKPRPVMFYCVDPQQEEPADYSNHGGISLLLRAVFSDAVREALLTRDYRGGRTEARQWLLTEGAPWAQALGLRITQEQIDSLAANGWQMSAEQRRAFENYVFQRPKADGLTHGKVRYTRRRRRAS